MSQCPKSPTGEHVPVAPPYGSWGTGTLMAGCGNIGTSSVVCEWCGVYGTEHWREQERQIPGRGPHAKECVRVVERVQWPTVTGAES